MGYSIAIDGPAGAGKSTVAKMISKELNFIYVDTGAMYRAMALYMIDNNIDSADEEKINEACKKVNIVIEYVNGEQQVILNGSNVTSLLRQEKVGEMASKCSTYYNVRIKLVELQRELAKKADVVMDGRDIGTYVLPNADLKIYLTADPYVRAKRRADELVAKGEKCSIDEIAKTIIERDERDKTREFAPLKKADDAVEVNTDKMNAEEVKADIINKFKEKVKK